MHGPDAPSVQAENGECEVVMPTLDPAPFLRGNPFPGTAELPYPRAVATDSARLPAGTWQAASTPIGVRLELHADADAVVVHYRTEHDGKSAHGPDAGRAFEVWEGDSRLVVEPAVLGEGSIELPLPAGAQGVTVYLPERMRPTLLSLTPVGGSLVPGTRRPRWLAYGDSIVEGWVASSPGSCWTARLSRRLGLDVCNLGYAGSARGELPSAEHLASVPADLISLSYGTNCWSTIPHTAALLRAGLDAFLTLLRQGNPDTPVVVTTPIRRPDAETTPNRLGATLADLRAAMAAQVQARIDGGDPALVLVDGETLHDDDLLADGIHPGEEGHALMADRLEPVIRAACPPCGGEQA
ncbi:GDSL-type esterase/lipase family protein [Frankia sp. Cpl3]|nr:GDSL-type esterase/lipase family protein [Frankia sp. Cpl3]